MEATRTCTTCGASSATVQFVKDRRQPDGLGSYCLPCNRERNKAIYRANAADRNRRTREYYAANREATLAQQRQYREVNIDRIRAYDRARYAADPEGRNAHKRRWAAENYERLLEQKRQYYLSNRDRIRDVQDCRRVEIAGFGARCEPIIRRRAWESYEGLCGICLEPVAFKVMELDHVKPISRGGSHTYDNVQPAHKPCNSGKRDREGEPNDDLPVARDAHPGDRRTTGRASR